VETEDLRRAGQRKEQHARRNEQADVQMPPPDADPVHNDSPRALQINEVSMG
jgi:hypothetical protein